MEMNPDKIVASYKVEKNRCREVAPSWIDPLLWSVERVDVIDPQEGEYDVKMVMHLAGKRKYVRKWADRGDCYRWLSTRRNLAGVPLTWLGDQKKVGEKFSI